MENLEHTTIEEIQAQVALLKKKLEHETIVNDKMLRKTMKHKAHVINRNAWISFIAALWVLYFSLFIMPDLDFSVWLIAATIVSMITCIFFTYKVHKDINSKTLNGDLITVIKVMQKIRDNYNRWPKIGISMSLVWGIWFIIEYCLHLAERGFQTTAIVIIASLIALSAGIGLFIGWRMHKSVVDNASDIINEIEECQAEEE